MGVILSVPNERTGKLALKLMDGLFNMLLSEMAEHTSL